MSDAFVGEIRMFGGNYAPVKWSFCDGQILTISQHATVYSLLGTAYGGNGQTTFGLPDMRGRLPVGQGSGPGLTPRVMGQKYGQETVTLSIDQIDSHKHNLVVSKDLPTATTFDNSILAKQSCYQDLPQALKSKAMPDDTIGDAGGNQAHENRMPFLAISFIICMEGVYPQRP